MIELSAGARGHCSYFCFARAWRTARRKDWSERHEKQFAKRWRFVWRNENEFETPWMQLQAFFFRLRQSDSHRNASAGEIRWKFEHAESGIVRERGREWTVAEFCPRKKCWKYMQARGAHAIFAVSSSGWRMKRQQINQVNSLNFGAQMFVRQQNIYFCNLPKKQKRFRIDALEQYKGNDQNWRSAPTPHHAHVPWSW